MRDSIAKIFAISSFATTSYISIYFDRIPFKDIFSIFSYGYYIQFTSVFLLKLTQMFGALISIFILDVISVGWSNSYFYKMLFASNRSTRIDAIIYAIGLIKITPYLAIIFTLGFTYYISPIIESNLSHINLCKILDINNIFYQVCIYFLIFTLSNYWNHRILHTKILWPLHRLHHSASELGPLTSYRNHPGGELITPITQTLPIALVGASPEVLLIVIAMNGFYQLLVHANVQWDWGWFGRWILISPMHHRLHHSVEEDDYGKNIGIFSIWDHIFGTYKDARSDIVCGVTDYNYNDGRSIATMLIKDYIETISNIISYLKIWSKTATH